MPEEITVPAEIADVLLTERRPGGVVVLTLNDPDRRNAMSDAMTAAWTAAMDDLRADRDVRCVVLTGAGSAFSSGGDLPWLADANTVPVPALRDRMLAFYRTWLAIRDLEVPTIAAVNGNRSRSPSRWRPRTCSKGSPHNGKGAIRASPASERRAACRRPLWKTTEARKNIGSDLR